MVMIPSFTRKYSSVISLMYDVYLKVNTANCNYNQTITTRKEFYYAQSKYDNLRGFYAIPQ